MQTIINCVLYASLIFLLSCAETLNFDFTKPFTVYCPHSKTEVEVSLQYSNVPKYQVCDSNFVLIKGYGYNLGSEHLNWYLNSNGRFSPIVKSIQPVRCLEKSFFEMLDSLCVE